MQFIKHGAIIPLAGGFSLGASKILNELPSVIFSWKPFYNNDKLYLRYLQKHNYNVPYYQIDDENINIDEITEQYKNKIHIFCGIPPCSGLSQAAQRKAGTRGSAPPNDWMYKSAEFILNNLQPIVYSFENAPTLFTNSGNDVRNKLIDIARKHGYSITFYKTNTLKHGIPQFRPRTFGIFYKGDYAPILSYYDKPYLKFKDYLSQIPKEAKHQNEYVHNEVDITKYEIYKFLKIKHGEKWREELNNFKPHLTTYEYLKRRDWLVEFLEWQKSLPENERSLIVTKNVEHILKKAAEGKNSRINYRVLEVDKDYTYAIIGEVMGKEIHPVEDRIMNVREYMHMMGLPHDYELESPKEYVKITQNIPVCTGEDITNEIVEIIKGNREFYKDSVLMQDNTKKYNHKHKSLF